MEKEIVRMGIDPGLGGAIAFAGETVIKLFDMPVETIPWAVTSRYKTRVNGKALYNLIKNCPYEIERITIEIVGPMPKQGVSSSWSFSGAFYTAFSISNLFMEPRMVLPAQWKKKYGLINMPKDYSRLTVLKMYPQLKPQLKRKMDVDRAEAFLIAGY